MTSPAVSWKRFNRTLLNEFFRVAFREKFYDSMEKLQKDLDKYLRFYNTARSPASPAAKGRPAVAGQVRPSG